MGGGKGGRGGTYGSALYLPPVRREKRCMFVALVGSAKRDLNWGAMGVTWVVRVELGLLMACFDSSLGQFL